MIKINKERSATTMQNKTTLNGTALKENSQPTNTGVTLDTTMSKK